MISFNRPIFVEKGLEYVQDSIIRNLKISGDGEYTKKCNKWIEDNLNTPKALLTTSCTHALEMAAILLDIGHGDEVIMPSYTFVSTANAFVLRGAKIKFVDIRPDTMNINEQLIENAITSKTKAIICVHYAGIACEMDQLCKIARRHKLFLIEDAAQGVFSFYKGKALGTIGDVGCYSFHETKNFTMGEGGALCIQNNNLINRAEIIREKGTDRTQYLRGEIDKYTWVDMGSSYLPSDINAAYLYAQLEMANEINEKRLHLWECYNNTLKEVAAKEYIELPFVPDECKHNAHMYYIKTKNIDIRTRLIKYLGEHDICSVFHYVPLHSSKAGKEFGEFVGNDIYTTKESERLLRLPMYYSLTEEKIYNIVDTIKRFYN